MQVASCRYLYLGTCTQSYMFASVKWITIPFKVVFLLSSNISLREDATMGPACGAAHRCNRLTKSKLHSILHSLYTQEEEVSKERIAMDCQGCL